MSHPKLFVSYCPNDNRPIGIDGDRFIDALCTWLAMADIDTFKDVAETKRVIRNCDGSIIVFSKSYLKSKRFLKNLYLIVRRQRRNSNHLIFPVFYDVDHADVKNQQGNFEIRGTVNRWRRAVTKVAKLRGMFASRDVLCGLVHLHNFGIVHRALKPSNVLLNVHNTFKWAKIADYGISKRLADGLMNLKGKMDFETQCWLPSEIHTEGVRETMAMDIFSFGCIVFYGVTGGKHPFGDYIVRFRRIMKDDRDLSLVENMPEAYDLIFRSVQHDPDLRPTAKELLHHPFFWDSKKRRLFLQTAGYRVEVAGYGSSLQIELDKTGYEVFSSGWIGSLDYDLQCYIYGLGHGTYRDDSLCDLLRVIRDLADHYFGLPSTVQSILGGVSRNLWDVLISFESYFRTKFPTLLMSVYETLSIPCGEEEAFRDYYRRP